MIFFSNSFGEPDLYNYIETNFLEFKIKKSKIFFWNLSKTDLIEIPNIDSNIDSNIEPRFYFLSGFSINNLKSISKCNYNSSSSYDFLYNTLNNERYDIIGNYFRNLYL